MKTIQCAMLALSLGITTLIHSIDGEFGRQYGSGSRLLQRPLFYKPYIKCHNKKCMYYKERCDELERQCDASLNQVCKLEKIADEHIQESHCVKQQLANMQYTLKERDALDQQQKQFIKNLETNVATLKDEHRNSRAHEHKLMKENSRLQKDQTFLTEEYIITREAHEMLKKENANLKQKYASLEQEKIRTQQECLKLELEQENLQLRCKLQATQNSFMLSTPFKHDFLPVATILKASNEVKEKIE